MEFESRNYKAFYRLASFSESYSDSSDKKTSNSKGCLMFLGEVIGDLNCNSAENYLEYE